MTLSEKYHAIFDFKLVKLDLPKWLAKGDKSTKSIKSTKSSTRLKREKISREKLKIAKKACKLLSKIPTVKFVGVTGGLAMLNAGPDSDIDLMIITSKNRLWLTRLWAYYILHTTYYILRKPRSSYQRNALCLNIWMDEDDLVWPKEDRNIYTSHEIAQIIPLVNKDSTYERFLYKNKWILSYWPFAIDLKYMEYRILYLPTHKTQYTTYNILYTFFEWLAYKLQYLYMKNKITREVVTPTRALFHPQDWGKVVLDRLKMNY